MKTNSTLLLSASLSTVLLSPLAGAREGMVQDRASSLSSFTANDIQPLPTNGRDINSIFRTLPTSQPGLGDQTTAITLRGIGSTRSQSPLFVVDGVPVTGTMGDLDPTFIDSVQVLKGPSAAALYGSAGAQGVIVITTKAQAGYTENPWRLHGGDQDDSYFASASLGAVGRFGTGRTSLSIGGDIGYTAYDRDLNRDDSEYDFNFSYLYNHALTNSFAVQSYGSLHSGAHQSIERGYQRTGLGFSNSLDYLFQNSAFYRFDGKELGQPGLEAATTLFFRGFDESGFSDRDVDSYGIDQEFSRILNDGSRVGVNAVYGMREWRRWYDFDADVLKVGAFVERDLGNGFSASVSGGWEQRDYDRLNIERDEFYLNGTLGGPIVKDKLWFFAAADYGVQENYLNAAASPDWIDPIGLRLATGLRASAFGPGTLGVDLRFQHLESDLFPGPTWEIMNTSLELNYELSANDFTVVPSVIYHDDDFDMGNDSDGFAFGCSVIKTF